MIGMAVADVLQSIQVFISTAWCIQVVMTFYSLQFAVKWF